MRSKIGVERGATEVDEAVRGISGAASGLSRAGVPADANDGGDGVAAQANLGTKVGQNDTQETTKGRKVVGGRVEEAIAALKSTSVAAVDLAGFDFEGCSGREDGENESQSESGTHDENS